MDDKKKPKPLTEATEKRSPGFQPDPNQQKQDQQGQKQNQNQDENEGEGSKSADRQYREHIREFEEQHDVESLGRSAKQDIERDPEGYRAAEEEGKKHIAEEDRELYKKE
jgi:hypothetical protein